MKFRIDKSILDQALQKIDTLIPTRDIQTLLSNVLLRIDNNNKLTLLASDMESIAEVTVDAETIETGEVIIKAKKLAEIARKIYSSKILLSLEDKLEETDAGNSEGKHNIIIQGDDKRAATFSITGYITTNFPHLNSISEDKLVAIPTDLFLEMIRKTLYAISQDDNRYIYNGICVTFDKKNISVVGTDGRRLSAIQRELPNTVQFDMSSSDKDEDNIVIHGKAIRELQHLLVGTDEFFIGKEQKDIFFKVENAKLSSRLLDGRFPEYKKVIPSEPTISFKIPREELLKALEQVMVMTEQPAFQTCFSINKNKVQVLTETPDLGRAEVTLDFPYSGEEIIIWFNSHFVNDIIKNLDCDEVELQLIDSIKPIVIKDTNDANFIGLVMPIGK